MKCLKIGMQPKLVDATIRKRVRQTSNPEPGATTGAREGAKAASGPGAGAGEEEEGGRAAAGREAGVMGSIEDYHTSLLDTPQLLLDVGMINREACLTMDSLAETAVDSYIQEIEQPRDIQMFQHYKVSVEGPTFGEEEYSQFYTGQSQQKTSNDSQESFPIFSQETIAFD